MSDDEIKALKILFVKQFPDKWRVLSLTLGGPNGTPDALVTSRSDESD